MSCVIVNTSVIDSYIYFFFIVVVTFVAAAAAVVVTIITIIEICIFRRIIIRDIRIRLFSFP